MKEQLLTWEKLTTLTIFAMIANWFLNAILLILGLRLQPNDIVAPHFIFFFTWMFPLSFFVRNLYSRPVGKRNSLILLFTISVLIVCTNLMAVAPTFVKVSECSADYSGFRVNYKCICKINSIEGINTYECDYFGIRLIPIVKEK